MTIRAQIIEDSISEQGKRLITFLLFYPRFIHAELMTHRVFSRNASSSRAIPFLKLLRMIRKDPAMPVHWGANQSGMQANAELTGWRLWAVKKVWIMAMWIMTSIAYLAYLCGVHKQIVNRMVEPWSHITVVLTATEYANWFALRNHPDAQPEIRQLALFMKRAMHRSVPRQLQPGEWHLPFVKQNAGSIDRQAAINRITANQVLRVVPSEPQILDILRKVSVARCARTSYVTHEGKVTTVDEDFALHERLLGAQPLHASPAEHQATPDTQSVYENTLIEGGDKEELIASGLDWDHPELHGNFVGWIQYRKTLEGEFVEG